MGIDPTNLNPIGPSGNVPQNYPFLNQWSQQLESFGQQHPELTNTPLFKETKAILDGWKKDAQDGKVLFPKEGDLSSEIIASAKLNDELGSRIGSTHLDVFAWSGFGKAEDLEQFSSIGTLTSIYKVNRGSDDDTDTPTVMDGLIMKYNDAVNTHTLPTGQDALLNALHSALLGCGSNGLNKYIDWVKSSFHLPPGDQAWLAQFDVRG